jgi:hypothetical protein
MYAISSLVGLLVVLWILSTGINCVGWWKRALNRTPRYRRALRPINGGADPLTDLYIQKLRYPET